MSTITFANATVVDGTGAQPFLADVLVSGDRIVDVAAPASIQQGTAIDCEGLLLTPGFIDLHGHGGGGHSFDDDADAILAGLATHRAHATTRSVISLVANPIDPLRTSLGINADLDSDDL